MEGKNTHKNETKRNEPNEWWRESCVKLGCESYTLETALDHLLRVVRRPRTWGFRLFIGRIFSAHVSYRDCVCSFFALSRIIFFSISISMQRKVFCSVLLSPLYVSCNSALPLAMRQIVQSNRTIWMQNVFWTAAAMAMANRNRLQKQSKCQYDVKWARWKWEFFKS